MVRPLRLQRLAPCSVLGSALWRSGMAGGFQLPSEEDGNRHKQCLRRFCFSSLKRCKISRLRSALLRSGRKALRVLESGFGNPPIAKPSQPSARIILRGIATSRYTTGLPRSLERGLASSRITTCVLAIVYAEPARIRRTQWGTRLTMQSSLAR